MIKKKFTKLLITLFLSSSILTLVACDNPKKDDQIVDKDNLDVWNETLSKLQGNIDGRYFFEGFAVQNTLKYVKKEREINQSVFITSESKDDKILTSGDNIIKSEIRWKDKKESVEIKLINVPKYQDFLRNKVTTNFNFNTDNTYKDIIDILTENINREEVSINFSESSTDLNTKLEAGEKGYGIQFSYNNKVSNIKYEKVIKIKTNVIKTDQHSLKEVIRKIDWSIANFTTDNTYQQVLDNIRGKIGVITIDYSTLQNNEIKIIFGKNLQLQDFLPEGTSEIKIKLQYNTSVEEATVLLSEFKTSELDLEIKKVDNEILDFTTEHTYKEVLDEINNKIDSKVTVEINDKTLEEDLNQKLPAGTNEITVNFEFGLMKKSKVIKIMNVGGPVSILAKEVDFIESFFVENLTWKKDQTYQEIYEEVKSLLKNKKIFIIVKRDNSESIEEVLKGKIEFNDDEEQFTLKMLQLKLCNQTTDLRIVIKLSKEDIIF